MSDLTGVHIDKMLLQEADLQQAEAVEMFRRQADGEDFEERAGQLIFEVYSRQRRYFTHALRLAEQQLTGQHFPNENDYLTAREIIYVQQAAMAMAGATRYGSLDKLVQRCSEAEEACNKKDKQIAALMSENEEIRRNQKPGHGK